MYIAFYLLVNQRAGMMWTGPKKNQYIYIKNVPEIMRDVLLN